MTERKRKRQEKALEKQEKELVAIQKKRRKCDVGNTIISPSAITNKDAERARLVYVLETVANEDIVERLKSAVIISDQSLKLLSTIFNEEIFPSASPSVECTRCGENYDPAYNMVEACKVKHPKDAINAVDSDQYGTDFECDECNYTWTVNRDCMVDEDISDCGYCFIGPHTTEKDPLKSIRTGLNT